LSSAEDLAKPKAEALARTLQEQRAGAEIREMDLERLE